MLSSYLKAEAQKAFDARRAAVAALKTPDDVARRQRELKAQVPRGARRLPREDAAERPGRRPRAARRLPRRAGHLREPARPPRHGACSTCPTGTRPFPGVLMPCGHSANGKAAETYQRGVHPAGEERHGRALLRPDRPGRAASSSLDAEGKPAGPGQHDRAHDGRRRRAARRPEHRELPHLGRHPQPRLPRQPARDRREAARLHRLLGRRHADVVPDGPRRPRSPSRRRRATSPRWSGSSPRSARRTPSRTSPARSPSAWTTPTTSTCAPPGRP